MGFIAFAVLWRLRRHSHAAGWLFGVYLLLAGVERLAVESIRVNTTYDLAGSPSPRRSSSPTVCIIAGCFWDVVACALTPSRRAADNTASTDAVAMFA